MPVVVFDISIVVYNMPIVVCDIPIVIYDIPIYAYEAETDDGSCCSHGADEIVKLAECNTECPPTIQVLLDQWNCHKHNNT